MFKQKKKQFKKYVIDHKSQRAMTQHYLDNISLFNDKLHKDTGLQQCILISDSEETTSDNKFQEALKILSGQVALKSIKGRQKQMKHISLFLKDNVANQISHNFPLIVSGVPGIGKTISVKSTVDRFIRNTKFPVKVVQINLMKLKSLNDTVPQFLKQLNVQLNTTKYESTSLLDTLFLLGQNPLISIENQKTLLSRKILIIDEMEFLVTNTHKQILYCLLNWLHYPHTNMLMILISNKIDLKIYQSRLGTDILLFKPYSSQQMIKIIETMLIGFKIFEQKAVQFAIKKVALSSSDIRKVIHLITLSIQICQKQSFGKKYNVSIDHIRKAHNMIYKSVPSTMMQILQPMQKLLLISICAQIKVTEKYFCYSSDLFSRYRQSVRVQSNKFYQLLFSLKQLGFLKWIEDIRNHINVLKIQLLISSDYIIKSLQNEPWLSPFIYELLV